MKNARLVVVRLGASPGLLWEIEQALAHLPRQRLVLALLGGSTVAPALVQHLAPVLGPTFAEALPQALPTHWTGRLYRGSAPAHRQHRVLWRRWQRACGAGQTLADPVERRVHHGLSTVGRAAAPRLARGVRQARHRCARPGPLARVAIGLAMLFGWFGAHWFYLGRPRRGIVYFLTLPLLMAPLFLGLFDAFRFLWFDRAGFDTLFSTPRGAVASGRA
jgi:Predicted membrane protein